VPTNTTRAPAEYARIVTAKRRGQTHSIDKNHAVPRTKRVSTNSKFESVFAKIHLFRPTLFMLTPIRADEPQARGAVSNYLRSASYRHSTSVRSYSIASNRMAYRVPIS